MKLQQISKKFFLTGIVFSVAIVWVVLFELNLTFFSFFKHSDHVDLIFLPAAIRLIAILLFKKLGVIGLFLGGVLTGLMHLPEYKFSTIVILSAISALSPYIAVQFAKYYLGINDVLSDFQPKQLLIICLIYALVNSLSHNLYIYLIVNTHHFFSNFLAMLTGDIIGCLLIIYAASFFIRLKRLNQSG